MPHMARWRFYNESAVMGRDFARCLELLYVEQCSAVCGDVSAGTPSSLDVDMHDPAQKKKSAGAHGSTQEKQVPAQLAMCQRLVSSASRRSIALHALGSCSSIQYDS